MANVECDLPPEVFLREYAPPRNEILDAAFRECQYFDAYLQRKWLTRAFISGRPTIRGSHYVGLMPYRCNHTDHLIVTMPKGCDDEDGGRGLLRFMELLAVSEGLPAVDVPVGHDVVSAAMRFLLFLASYYGCVLRELCRRDFRLYYHPQEEELCGRVRGRIHVGGYIRNVVRGRGERVPCRWEEFTPDNWDNRILWGAATRLKSAASNLAPQASQYVQKALHGITTYFEPVEDVHITSSDLHRARLHRTSKYYARALALARLILQGADRPMAGGNAPPLVIDANVAFERFSQVIAEAAVRRLAVAGWHAERNQKTGFLFGRQPQKRAPDIRIKRGNGVVAVGDAKYKDVLESIDADGRTAPGSLNDILGNSQTPGARSGIGERDWDQLYVYMRLNGARCGFFVVPFWDVNAASLAFEDDFEFKPPPGNNGARVAVIGLNLLCPLGEVRRKAAEQLAAWLRKCASGET
jgi:hypothetical protein